MNNGTGLEDAWTFISSGITGFTASNLAATARNTTVAPVNVTNNTAHTSYKLVFPALRLGNATANTPSNPNGLQISEVRMFNAPAGGGTNVAALPTTAIAIDQTDSGSPPTESPANAIDNNPATKYLNFGREGTGLIITPAAGSTTVGGLQITTANDAPASQYPSHLASHWRRSVSARSWRVAGEARNKRERAKSVRPGGRSVQRREKPVQKRRDAV